MKALFLSVLLLAACAHPPAEAQTSCPPAGYDRAALLALRAADFEIADARVRARFAFEVTACLADSDPAIRDGIAYEALTHMLRARQLGASTQSAVVGELLLMLERDDTNGFARPFSALALSESVRADRINAHFTDGMYADVLNAAIIYVTSISDYRGFDEAQGWRHGVAHGADLLMQIALNPHYGRADLIRVRDAIAAQIAPPGHFYIYGESERLARPILMIARRGVLSAEEWTAWCAEISGPGPLGAWDGAFASNAGLARRHDLSAFASALYLTARLSDDPALAALLPGAEAMVRALP